MAKLNLQQYINNCIIKCYLEEERYLRSMILKHTKGASLEIAQDFIMRYFQRRPYIEGNVVIIEYNPIDQTMLIEKGEWLENDEITKKILKLQGREVKNMGFTIKDLKELIKDAPDDLPVEVIGRYIGESNMVMTDVGIDNESLWFELGYEFDRAGYLE